MNTEQMIQIDFSRNITPFVPGDVYYNNFVNIELTMDQQDADAFNNADTEFFNTYFIVSFADRPNTGKQPVDDDVVVDLIIKAKGLEFVGKDPSTYSWTIRDHPSDIKSWKINHAALLAKFKEQGAKQMNYLEQETELATHYSANNNCFYIQESHIECFAMVLDDVGRWIYSDCTTNEELNGDEFFALDADQDNHKEDAHHIALQIEKLGNQPQHHIELAIAAGAVDDIVISPEQIIEPWVADHLKGVGAVATKPVFTQAMHKDGIMPPIGSDCMVYGTPYVGDTDWYSTRVCGHKDGKVIGDSLETGGAVDLFDKFKPIDNRTPEDKAMDAMWDSYRRDEKHGNGYPPVVIDILNDIKAGKIHGVKWSL